MIAGNQDSNITVDLFERFLGGDETAAEKIYERFAERVRRKANELIGARLRPRAGPDDALQSAFRTFFEHAREGQFLISESGQLWRLLARITTRKIQRLAERHTAACRDVRREEPGVDCEITAEDASVESFAILQDEIDALVAGLSPREGEILCLSLRGVATDDIAAVVGRSVATVRRVAARAKFQLEERLAGDTEDAEAI